MNMAARDHYANQKIDVDELIKTHSDLVRKIAWQIHGREFAKRFCGPNHYVS